MTNDERNPKPDCASLSEISPRPATCRDRPTARSGPIAICVFRLQRNLLSFTARNFGAKPGFLFQARPLNLVARLPFRLGSRSDAVVGCVFVRSAGVPPFSMVAPTCLHADGQVISNTIDDNFLWTAGT